jgi:integrase/recombinase XerD
MVLFENAIKTEATKRTYKHHLSKFLRFCNTENPETILALSNDQIQTKLEDYLFYLKEKVSPNSIASIFAAIELFLSLNDKVLNFKKIKKMFPAKVKKSGSRAWTTKEVSEIMGHAKSRRSRALLLFLASSGCRMGTLEDLRLKHLVEMPSGCKAVHVYAETNLEYWTFLTPEASAALNEYFEERQRDGEVLMPDSPAFRQAYQSGKAKVFALSVSGAEVLISRLVKSAKLKREKSGNRYDTQLAHALRKRFATILKINETISYSTTEALLGHKSGLDATYYKPDFRTQLFEEYKKAILELTVSSEERQKLTIAEKERKISEFGTQQTQIDDLKQIATTLTEQVKKLSLKQEIEKQWREQLFDWGSKNLTPESFAKLTKTDLSAIDGLEEMVEHIMKEHDGKFDSSSKFKLRFQNC